MKFARLFDIRDEQLLVYTEVNPEMDTTTVHHITDTIISRIDTRIEIKSEDHDVRARVYLANLTEEAATRILTDMQDMLNN